MQHHQRQNSAGSSQNLLQRPSQKETWNGELNEKPKIFHHTDSLIHPVEKSGHQATGHKATAHQATPHQATGHHRANKHKTTEKPPKESPKVVENKEEEKDDTKNENPPSGIEKNKGRLYIIKKKMNLFKKLGHC